jgi:DNA-binding SARP family transcriptional activator/tetratricopeptide (TPR) repeat protein
MAELAGVSERTVRYLEQGMIQRPRQASLRQLQAVLQRSGLTIEILGPLVVRHGERLVVIAGPQLSSLLGLLALNANQVVSHAEIVETLWGHEPPATYRELLHGVVSRLRKILGSDVIKTRHSGYLINVGPEQLDLLRFDEAREANKLADALGYWRSDLLADLPEAIRQHPAAIAVGKRRLATALAYADAAIERGEHENAVSQLRSLLPGEPLHEALHAKLMLALAAGGQQAESLALYAQIHDRLVTELGVEPGEELRKTHLRVLRGDVPSPRQQPGPAQLPADVHGFSGRAEALALLDAAQARRLVVVHGIAGMGKTALAVHWGHRATRLFPDGQLYVNMRGFDPAASPVHPGHVLGRFLRAFGADPARIPQDTDERAAQFRSALAGKRVLIVLDNVATADQVRPLLPGSASCFVLVTSRNQLGALVALDGAQHLALAPLGPSEALALLENTLGEARVAREPSKSAELSKLCGYLPLALRLAAGKLSLRPQQTIRALINELTGECGLAALQLIENPREGVSAAFDVSYAALSPPEQVLFRRLGLVPGPDFTVQAVASLLEVPDPGEAAGLLDRLIVANLVEPYASGRYRLHDLVRLYAREMRGADDEAYARLMNFYLSNARAIARLLYADLQYLDDKRSSDVRFMDASQARAWMQAEEANIVAAIHDAADSPVASMAWLLADATNGYFLMRSRNLDEWRISARAAIQAAEQAGDERAQAAMHLAVGSAYWRLGDLREFVDSCTCAWKLAGRAQWHFGMAHALAFICQGKLGLGRASEVLEPIERLIAESRARDFPLGVSYGLIVHGNALAQLGELHQASLSLQEGRSIGRESGAVIVLGEALQGLGRVYSLLGQKGEAAQAYADAVVVARQQGAWHQPVHNLMAMTRMAYQSGDRATAETLVQQALKDETHNRASQVDVLLLAGWLSMAYGEPTEALGRYGRAYEVAHGSGFRFAEAESLVGLAGASLRLAELDQAVSFARQALDLAEAGGYQVTGGQALTVLAESELGLGQFEQARIHARQALETHRRTGHEPGERLVLEILDKVP